MAAPNYRVCRRTLSCGLHQAPDRPKLQAALATPYCLLMRYSAQPVIKVLLAAALLTSTLPAQTIVHGLAARAEFESYRTIFEMDFIDFESVSIGAINTALQPSYGVTFFSTIATNGTAIIPPHNAYVSAASVNGDTSRKLVGTPFVFGSDDGRVGYEIRFDSPQSIVGLERNWQTGNALTRFYNSEGTLLATHANTTNIEFVGWIADFNDPLTWVSRIGIDGLSQSGTRQVGYTDDLFFGTFAIPEPSTYALLLMGLGGLWFSLGPVGRKA